MTTTLKSMILEALKDGDSADDMRCFIYDHSEQSLRFPEIKARLMEYTLNDLPEYVYDDEVCTPSRPPFIGFTPRYVYVCVQCRGLEWVDAVPRHPEFVSQIDWIGA